MSMAIDSEKFRSHIMSLHRTYYESFRLLENKMEDPRWYKNISEIQGLLNLIKWKSSL
jgi:hypothetical protein